MKNHVLHARVARIQSAQVPVQRIEYEKFVASVADEGCFVFARSVRGYKSLDVRVPELRISCRERTQVVHPNAPVWTQGKPHSISAEAGVLGRSRMCHLPAAEVAARDRRAGPSPTAQSIVCPGFSLL